MTQHIYEDATGLDNDPDIDPEDALDGLDEDAESPEETGADQDSGDARQSAAARGVTRAQVRRIAVKAQEVAEADDETRALTAHLVGSGTGLADLVTAIMCAPRSTSGAVTDFRTIVESDMWDAGVKAHAMGRPRIRAVWALLVALGVELPEVPQTVQKAAPELAKAIFAHAESVTDSLEAALTLAKKS